MNNSIETLAMEYAEKVAKCKNDLLKSILKDMGLIMKMFSKRRSVFMPLMTEAKNHTDFILLKMKK